jgi:hypothetical protein
VVLRVLSPFATLGMTNRVTSVVRHGALLAALALLAPAGLSAQGFIRGVLVDSLRGATPIAGAIVTLDGTSYEVETDRRGRFAFPRLPAGAYEVVYRSARLDTLGIAPITQAVTIEGRSAADVRLAIPGPAAFQREYCGTELKDAGIVRGTVVDARGTLRPGAHVAGIWDEAILVNGDLTMETRASVDTTAADGSFSVCGVPLARQFVLRVVTGDERAGDLVVELDGDLVVRRDVRVGRGDETSVITGRVLSRRRGQTVAVELWGDSLRSTATDGDGRFRLAGVPRRSGQLYLRAVGQTPRIVTIDPIAPTLDIGDVQLEDAAVALQPMTIRERQLTRERLAFEERSRGAVGVFFDSTYLASLPRVTAAALAQKSTVLRVGPVRSAVEAQGEVIMLRSSHMSSLTSGCYPRVYLNGVMMQSQQPRQQAGGMVASITPDYMKELLRTAKRIEVYQAQFAPVEFADPDGCGSLVIWTR